MADRRQQLGRVGEQMAAELLAGQGYQILARNWRSGRSGEIDLVAQDDACLVIVEVRTPPRPELRQRRGIGDAGQAGPAGRAGRSLL
jgi:Holliday junction resolvase-like predicted endonuclease